jgi:hypothetical protein
MVFQTPWKKGLPLMCAIVRAKYTVLAHKTITARLKLLVLFHSSYQGIVYGCCLCRRSGFLFIPSIAYSSIVCAEDTLHYLHSCSYLPATTTSVAAAASLARQKTCA